MANFYGIARTNYFKVKDLDLFNAWLDEIPDLVLIEKDGLVGFYSDCPDSGTFPSSVWNDDANDYIDLDLVQEVAKHLTEDSIAVLMEAGAENKRYISAWAQAVNHNGEVESVSLGDIYDLAEERFGIKPTPAEY